MWSYLKADLEELVSVVKEDTNVVMEKMADDTKAKKQSAAVKEARRRAGEAETYTVPLLVSRHTTTATTTPNSTAVAGSAPNEEEEEEADDADADDAEPVDAEEARRVAAFLQSLHLVDRADEIDRLLRLDDGGGEEEDETRIGAHYAALVPDTISPDEFWQRYYYRCDAARIAHDWADADERHRQARAALVGTVSNFFGAAAHAVAASVGGGRADPDHAPPAAATTRGLHGLFGGSAGRPPFVMNTALDEDGDDDDEEEEEEELGWDDDDEDEDEEVDARNEESSDVVNSSSVGGNEEQIEFKDEALDAVKEQLKQAIEERDLLHQTVALQSKEIASLKTGGVDPTIETLEPMRVALEAKDTEFASVMQALEREMVKSAASEEQSNKLQAQVVHLTGLLAAKETPPIATQDATTASTSTTELEDVIRSLQNENELLRQKLNEGAVREATTTEQLASLQDEVVLCRANIAATAAELDATRARLAATQSDAAGVQAALDRRVRAADDDDEVHHHQQQGAAAAAAAITDEDAGSGGAKSAATMDTTSTGDCVKVTRHRTAAPTNTTPSSVVSTRAVGDHDTDDNGEAEEGWGDDWD